MSDARLQAAAAWIGAADHVLICAGAGMSAAPGDANEHGGNVYVDPVDFARHYAPLIRYGYKTCYEAMGLFGDPKVPLAVKYGFLLKHANNMLNNFPPNEGYALLRKLVGSKDYFVYTSNVDRCFARAGFDPSRVYTPQGEYAFYQCRPLKGGGGPCAPDSAWPIGPLFDEHLGKIGPDTLSIEGSALPACPRCGAEIFCNLRGGDWFLHDPHMPAQRRLIEWIEQASKGPKGSLVILEIGAGFNTPVVTRWPMESIARLEGGRLIRINIDHPEVPADLRGDALGLPLGWECLREMLGLSADLRVADVAAAEAEAQSDQAVSSRGPPAHLTWRHMLAQLAR